MFETILKAAGVTTGVSPNPGRIGDKKRFTEYRVTKKQREVLKVIIAGNEDGSPVQIHDVLRLITYKTSEHSMRFTIRHLEARQLLVKRAGERNGFPAVFYLPTTKAFQVLGMDRPA